MRTPDPAKVDAFECAVGALRDIAEEVDHDIRASAIVDIAEAFWRGRYDEARWYGAKFMVRGDDAGCYFHPGSAGMDVHRAMVDLAASLWEASADLGEASGLSYRNERRMADAEDRLRRALVALRAEAAR